MWRARADSAVSSAAERRGGSGPKKELRGRVAGGLPTRVGAFEREPGACFLAEGGRKRGRGRGARQRERERGERGGEEGGRGRERERERGRAKEESPPGAGQTIEPIRNPNMERIRDRPWFNTTFSKLHVFALEVGTCRGPDGDLTGT